MKRGIISCFLRVTPSVPKSHMSYETLLFNNIKKVILWSSKILKNYLI